MAERFGRGTQDFIDILEDAAGPFGAVASVFGLDQESHLNRLFGTADVGPALNADLLGAVVLETLRSGRPMPANPISFDTANDVGFGHLAIPVFLEDEFVALVVLRAPEVQLAACARRFDPLLFPIALYADRVRSQAAIVQKGEEISALRRQLDSYAVDFRSTYRAEQDRSLQLASALAELEQAYHATVQSLAAAVEAKDESTGGHLQRVCRYGMMLTAIVAPEHAHDLQFEYGFLLHDIGKLAVPDLVLRKPGPLNPLEWTLMRQHSDAGRSILSEIPFLSGAAEIVHAHHERWDGAGYPRGLAGEDIPLGALVFPLCDAFDAMTSDRPYRPALSSEEARSEIRRGSGTQFWSPAVEAFLDLSLADIESVRAKHHGGAGH